MLENIELIDEVRNTAEYNGIKVLQGFDGYFQVGSNMNQELKTSLDELQNVMEGIDDELFRNTLNDITTNVIPSIDTIMNSDPGDIGNNITTVSGRQFGIADYRHLIDRLNTAIDNLQVSSLPNIKSLVDGLKARINGALDVAKRDTLNEWTNRIKPVAAGQPLTNNVGATGGGTLFPPGDVAIADVDAVFADPDKFVIRYFAIQNFVRDVRTHVDNFRTQVNNRDLYAFDVRVELENFINGVATIPQNRYTKYTEVADELIDRASGELAKLGATQNSLDHNEGINSIQNSNLTSARSIVEDADILSEYVNMVNSQVKTQAATFVMSQANQKPQSVLSLLG